jgi:hypothetical protein
MKNISKERQRGLEFHIKVNDYFVSLATLLYLLQETLGNSAEEQNVARCLKKSVNDLMYLQRNCKIVGAKKIS